MVKYPLANAGDVRDAGLIPGLGRSSGGGHSYPLQYSCLENPMDKGAWRATVHGIAKESDTTEAMLKDSKIKIPGCELPRLSFR